MATAMAAYWTVISLKKPEGIPYPNPCRYIGLEPALAVGMCVLSSCPGGTASNIVAYIAKVRSSV